jgi:streptogramin lyase
VRSNSTAVRLVLATLVMSGCDSSLVGGNPDPTTSPVSGLWMASGQPSTILRLDQDQLRTGGDLDPATTLTTPSASDLTLTSMAFDADGTLWLASPLDSALLAFSAAGLTVSGDRAATRVIGSVDGSLALPSALAFDRVGRLWVANHGAGTVVGFDRATLLLGGHPAPAVTLGGFGHPTGLALDSEGALWVSDNTANTVARYEPAAIAQSGAPAPTVVLRGDEASCLQSPSGLAFDADGTLWVANLGCGTVIGVAASDLAASGPVHARVTLSDPASSLTPVGVAFDSDGDLWVLTTVGALTEYAGTSASGGAHPATARISLPGHFLFWGLAFWPRPPGAPTY